MSEPSSDSIGRVVSILRYPVKSMLGEELNATHVAEQGLLGDRAFALADSRTGKIASAKDPRQWPNLFDFRAAFVAPLDESAALLPVRITFPDGSSVTTDQDDADARLSAGVGRTVTLIRQPPKNASAAGYWPDYDWLGPRDQDFEFPLPPGTFFDGASIHLLTTATLDRLRAAAPASRFEIPRFRPNFVIDTRSDDGFIENGWVGRTLTLGSARLRIDGPCPRCIMTTLPQGSLPKDPDVLRTAVQRNDGNVGVYATVVRSGQVRRGDAVAFE